MLSEHPWGWILSSGKCSTPQCLRGEVTAGGAAFAGATKVRAGAPGMGERERKGY